MSPEIQINIPEQHERRYYDEHRIKRSIIKALIGNLDERCARDFAIDCAENALKNTLLSKDQTALAFIATIRQYSRDEKTTEEEYETLRGNAWQHSRSELHKGSRQVQQARRSLGEREGEAVAKLRDEQQYAWHAIEATALKDGWEAARQSAYAELNTTSPEAAWLWQTSRLNQYLKIEIK